ncbi:MAG: Sec-independent protein translocase TatA [Flexistipes sinusarabici]|uniref:Sec-independent protein translocase protein TatA n=1 Tax=Flexistipes sinusarabici TaxID=2352 RepID=A0A5D0MQR4_FLESI|nr:twin-arginine translocase TatA/TatE family subunit [Flexistipes sinusarabici]TYB33129.1 MAG: Sec-independent protein translocase TatA [Flexistipes sinusarabici]
MFGLGMTEVILILVLALIVVGPKKLPEVAKGLGKGFAEFKKMMNDFKDAVNIDDIDESSSSSPRSKNKEISEVYKNKWQQDILQAEEDNDQKNGNNDDEDDKDEITDNSEESGENVKHESRET